MSWEFDAPAGVYKNHALSSDIRKQAIARALFMRFLSPENGFGKKRGESVTITRVLSLPLAERVAENQRLPSVRPVIQTKQQAVSDWGVKVPMTKFEMDHSHFDIESAFDRALMDQIALTMDKMGADAMKTTPYKYIPLAAGSVFDTDGTPSSTADKNLAVDDLRNIHDELSGVLKCPKFDGGTYVGILSTKAARGIKNDSEYKDWQAPTTAMPFVTGMLKDVEGFTLFETNHFDALSNGIGTSSVLGEAVFFGADSAFLVTSEEPELRAGLQGDDLGRVREIGWVGTLEAGLTWETAALSRVVHVTSA